MTKKKPPKKVPGRYGIAEITQRVERERARKGYEVKEMAERSGFTQTNWYKKAGGPKAKRRSDFTVEDLGRIADALSAPPLWPFAEWTLLEKVFPGTPAKNHKK